MKFSLWPRPRAARFHHRRYLEDVLGTSLELQIVTGAPESGPLIEAEILSEIERLEAIFSVYKSDSEFNRWQQTRQQNVEVSAELAHVLAQSQAWRARSHGAFNPAVEALTQLWKSGAQSGIVPDAAELAALASAVAAPLWSVDEGNRSARRLTDERASLHSVAKGFIVDRAVDRARQNSEVADVLVNIGGDLCHVGAHGLTVAVADPFTLADNAAPIAQIRLSNAALATSGRARRGFMVGQRWFSHVIDPRTGWPVRQTVSASVVAPNALTADVLATIGSVVSPDEAIALTETLHGVGLFLVSADGEVVSNAAWREREI